MNSNDYLNLLTARKTTQSFKVCEGVCVFKFYLICSNYSGGNNLVSGILYGRRELPVQTCQVVEVGT